MKKLNLDQLQNISGAKSGITYNDVVCFGIGAVYSLATPAVGLLAAAACMVADGATSDSGDECWFFCN